MISKRSQSADVRALAPEQLQPLADEVRQRLIDVVRQTGGHIGAGLGVVELTVALCAAFESPRDKIVMGRRPSGLPLEDSEAATDRLHTSASRMASPAFCVDLRVSRPIRRLAMRVLRCLRLTGWRPRATLKGRRLQGRGGRGRQGR